MQLGRMGSGLRQRRLRRWRRGGHEDISVAPGRCPSFLMLESGRLKLLPRSRRLSRYVCIFSVFFPRQDRYTTQSCTSDQRGFKMPFSKRRKAGHETYHLTRATIYYVINWTEHTFERARKTLTYAWTVLRNCLMHMPSSQILATTGTFKRIKWKRYSFR